MIRNFIVSKKEYFVLTAIYLICHGMMIVISGIWWDDWTLWTSSLDDLIDIALQTGSSPWSPLIRYLLMAIPNGGYRFVIFVLFLFCCLLFYQILLSIPLFQKKMPLVFLQFSLQFLLMMRE